MNEALQSKTLEYRWGVVAASEPVGIRTIRGYVTILERQNARGGPLGYHILFFDVDGRPIQSFLVDDFPLFTSAAYLAWKELGLPVLARDALALLGTEIATLVPLASTTEG
jgi:hypothetical protein